MPFIEWQKSRSSIDNNHVIEKKSSYFIIQTSLSPYFGLKGTGKLYRILSYHRLTGSKEGTRKKKLLLFLDDERKVS